MSIAKTTTASDPTLARNDPAWAGQVIYTPRTLRVYDAYVLGFSCGLLWRCSSARMLALYNELCTARHMDVGVGSGYFVDKCRFPVARPDITLFDANASSLAAASARLARYAPKTHQGNLLAPIDLPAASFDSISMNFVLHCLPGPFSRKAVALAHLAPLLRPGGVLFGSTVLRHGVPSHWLARFAMDLYNARGYFSNADDDPQKLEAALAQNFARYELRIVGAVALFRAYRAAD